MLDDIAHDDILELRLARPPVNALDPQLVCALRDRIAAPAKKIRAMVLSGRPGMFSAGLDVPALLELDRESIHAFWRDFFDLMRAIAAAPVPVVAAVTGHSPAGGAVLAIFSDFRVAAAGEFKIGLNEVRVGLPVPGPIFVALSRLVGAGRAEQMLATGELITPQEALSRGLVDRVVAPADVVPVALARAREMAGLPPRALAFTRATVRRELVSAFAEIDDAFLARITEAWFGAETRSAMSNLVERLKA